LGKRSAYFIGAGAAIVLAGQLSLLMFHVALPVVAPLFMLGSGFVIGTVIFLDTDLRVRNRELAAARESMQIRAEEERKRIAGDLHDETLPALSSVARMIDELGDEHQESAVPTKMRRKLDETIQEMRRVINDLHPSVLETMGFVPALENLAVMLQRDTGIVYTFTDGDPDAGDNGEGSITSSGSFIPLSGANEYELSDFAKLQLYRIVQEALNNVGKHSRAKIVDVCIRQRGDDLEISITDDGQGINPKAVRPDSHGLTNIKHRAQLIGASVEWRKPKKFETGTEIRLTIPMLRENGIPPTITAEENGGKNDGSHS
jgi:signal transduction histidine kinase